MVKPHWIADSFHYESIHDKWTLVLMQRLSSILIHFHELMVPSNNLLLMLCGHVNFSVRCALSVRWDIAQQTSLGDIRLIIQNRNIDLKGAWKHSGPCWRERKKRRHLLDHLPTPHTRLLFFCSISDQVISKTCGHPSISTQHWYITSWDGRLFLVSYRVTMQNHMGMDTADGLTSFFLARPLRL